MPVEESFLDGFAVGVLADAALALVADQVERGGIGVTQVANSGVHGKASTCSVQKVRASQ